MNKWRPRDHNSFHGVGYNKHKFEVEHDPKTNHAYLIATLLCSKLLLKFPLFWIKIKGATRLHQDLEDVANYSQACPHVQETYKKSKFILRPNTSSQKVLSSLGMGASTCGVCVRVSTNNECTCEHQWLCRKMVRSDACGTDLDMFVLCRDIIVCAHRCTCAQMGALAHTNR